MRAFALAILVHALVACGQAAPEAKPAAAPAEMAAAPPAAPLSARPADSLPSLDALATRGPSVAPGMREVSRDEIVAAGGAAERSIVIVQAGTADTCSRVALVAQPAVRAWLTDGRGDRLAEVSDATDALLAPSGPVCVRKGHAVTLHVEAQAPYGARFVAWASP